MHSAVAQELDPRLNEEFTKRRARRETKPFKNWDDSLRIRDFIFRSSLSVVSGRTDGRILEANRETMV